MICGTYLSKNTHQSVVVRALEGETFLVLHRVGVLGKCRAFRERPIYGFSDDLEIGLAQGKDYGAEQLILGDGRRSRIGTRRG
jgi:hypothetical protein